MDGGAIPSLVLHLVHRWEPGGVRRHLRDLTGGLAAIGVRSIVAAQGIHADAPPDADAFELELYTSAGRKSAHAALHALRRLRELIRERGVTLVHAHSRYAALLAAGLGPVPCVYTSHSVFREGPLPPYPAVVICPTAPGARSFAARRQGHDVLVVPHGFDPAPAIDAEAAGRADADRAYVFVLLTRLDGGKGLDTALEGCAELLRGRVNARLVIAGDGPGRRACEQRAAELGIADSVRCVGHVEDTRPLLRDARALIAPSTGVEGFGYAVSEALAAGVPVIASSLAVFDDRVVDGETGLRFPAGDAAALARCLLQAAREPERMRMMGARGRARITEFYTLARMVDGTLEAYRRALRAAPREWGGSCSGRSPR